MTDSNWRTALANAIALNIWAIVALPLAAALSGLIR